MVNANLVMPTYSVSCAKQAQDFPAIIANPDACTDFTKLCRFLVYVDLQIWQLGESYRCAETSWTCTDNCYAKQLRRR
jgi:hypothetical protein